MTAPNAQALEMAPQPEDERLHLLALGLPALADDDPEDTP